MIDEKRLVKSIDLPFAIGEKLWVVELYSYSREVECLKCQATGSVTLADGTNMPCGICGGRKTHQIHKDYKNRPVYHTITGYDIYNKRGQFEIWYYTDKTNNFVRPEQFIRTFAEARKSARTSNKKYGWPKKDYRPMWPDKSLMYWGYRVGNNRR